MKIFFQEFQKLAPIAFFPKKKKEKKKKSFEMIISPWLKLIKPMAHKSKPASPLPQN